MAFWVATARHFKATEQTDQLSGDERRLTLDTAIDSAFIIQDQFSARKDQRIDESDEPEAIVATSTDRDKADSDTVLLVCERTPS